MRYYRCGEVKHGVPSVHVSRGSCAHGSSQRHQAACGRTQEAGCAESESSRAGFCLFKFPFFQDTIADAVRSAELDDTLKA